MTDQPNILVLFNDDHGQWALPSYGNSELRTPSIDYLAQSGVVMENAFTPIPVCSPARACFFTGLLPSQHGIHDYIAAAREFHTREWMKPFETLPEKLCKAGYECGFSGKWHLGRDELVQNGFSDWFALSGDYPIQHKGVYRYSDNGRDVELAGYKTHHITDRTIRFLQCRDKNAPFFHFTSFYATHSPWSGQPERLVEPYRDCGFDDIPSAERVFGGEVLNIEHSEASDASKHEAKAQYYASVSAIDEAVGRILDELETSGDLENTIILYTSDHGLCLGHHGIWGKGNATAPQNLIEESIRVPMIYSAQGRYQSGVRLQQFADHMDSFKTLASAAGVLDYAMTHPGGDLSALLQGQNDVWRDFQVAEYGTARMIRTKQHKLIRRYDNRPDELFDLSVGDGEGNNLIADPSYSGVSRDLGDRLEAYFEQHGVPPKDADWFFGDPQFNRAEAWR
ncbi:sulfatase family protein [Ruegeria hyattellae]|uniref:sulfatase family protein n=1 Tax=Ruegeria hyattellae TaxID=3233337 RepID=UPI00355C0559